MPLILISQLSLSGLAENSDQLGLNGVTVGQLATAAAIGHLGHIGGITIGDVKDALPKLSQSRTGPIGDLPLEKLKSAKETLGLFSKLTIGQLLTLGRIGLLEVGFHFELVIY